MSQPIDYASPNPTPKKSWVGKLVVIVIACLIIAGLAFLVGLMGGNRQVTITVAPVAVNAVAPPTPVVLSSDPMVFDLRQRSGMQLPGGKDTPYLSIGDITRGQVLVTVQQYNGPTLLSKSMKEDDSASFTYGLQTLHLKVAKLTNRLTGDDQAQLELSASAPLSQEARIDALIAHLEVLEGATFIRNGSPHTAKEAADHLRRKRDYVGDKITTAEQFIDELASKSSQSGEPYKIKLKDGSEVPAGEYLKQKLPEIDAILRGQP